MAAGLATLRELERPGAYEALELRSRALVDGLAALSAEAEIELATAAVGGMFGFFFHPGPVRSFGDARKASGERFRRFFHAMLARGVYLAPSAFEAGFVSLAHRPVDLAETLEAARQALRGIRRGARDAR
jgi:glutamate-1-semialdehyde 2,1-aminomutase